MLWGSAAIWKSGLLQTRLQRRRRSSWRESVGKRGSILRFALVVIAVFPLSCRRAEVPSKSAKQEDSNIILSVLQHGDTLFACTPNSFYDGSVKDKTWQQMQTPTEMSPRGTFVQQSMDSPLLAYFTGIYALAPKNAPTLFISKDAGKTWSPVFTERRFTDVFIHPNGSIYAIEETQNRGHHLLFSRDLGATWKVISPDFTSNFWVGGLFQDPDHPDLACFGAESMMPSGRPFVYQADDASYQWKRIEATQFHSNLWMGVNRRTSSIRADIPGRKSPTITNYFETHSDPSLKP